MARPNPRHGRDLILFVPGQGPKPPAETYRAALWRCLVEGVRRAEAPLAAELGARADCFRLIAWNHSYYGVHADIERDRRSIDRMLAAPGPTALDIREAQSLRVRLAWLVYSLADLLPFLVHFLPDPEIRATLEASRRYFENDERIGDRVRELLCRALDEAAAADTRVLLIGHSLGSVVAYDTLWERGGGWRVDLFLTLGSPLGVRFVQRRLRGAHAAGRDRYPVNVRRWVNIAAVGELRALDRRLRGDYAEMLGLGLLEALRDETEGVYNNFREGDRLNVHRDYGYLVNPVTGRAIADWWRE
ncbi:MAG TPA: hypothetical protein VM616_08255 [Gammaproteobacteria bacterium]|nr:hypothetical protein [Gammaproteobacteria bacterium]